MDPPQDHRDAPRPVVRGDVVGAVGAPRDGADTHQVGLCIQGDGLHAPVHEADAAVGPVQRQRCQGGERERHLAHGPHEGPHVELVHVGVGHDQKDSHETT